MTSCSPCTTLPAPERPALARLSAVFLLLAGLLLAACSEAPRLPALGVDLGRTSVSGLSSGAYMAGQFHLAHSKLVMGAGIVAGGPYGCAESVFGRVTPVWPAALAQNLNRALNACSGTSMAGLGVPDVGRLARRARDRADGGIDALDGLRGDRVYLFAGLNDRSVAPALVRKAADLYAALGVAQPDIAFVENPRAGHGFLVEDGGNACGATAQPFLNDCDYDQAGAILKHIYGALNPPARETGGQLVLFAQDEFTGGGGGDMDGKGALFVPETCARAAGCRVHVVFHGCRQGREAVGDAFVKGAGYNRWAAANRIVVVYPQAAASADNPRGCWDWWGYTGPAFLTRDAPQIRAVRAMLARLAEAAR